MSLPKGVSGNPKGAPKKGTSWAEIYRKFLEMTPEEAAAGAAEIGKRLLSYGETPMMLKELIVLRHIEALLFDIQPGLLNTLLERTAGKVKDVIEHQGGSEVTIRFGGPPDPDLSSDVDEEPDAGRGDSLESTT